MTSSRDRPPATTSSSTLSLPQTLSSALSWTISKWNSSTSDMTASLASLTSPTHTSPPSPVDTYSSSYSPPFHDSSSPPPLPPVTLTGYHPSTRTRLLAPPLAEELRALLPARLQLHDTWTLAYSLEQHGVSLSTLYARCARREFARGGFVVVVKDRGRGDDPARRRRVFGAFVNEPLRVGKGTYYGTGECFLWKARWDAAAAGEGDAGAEDGGGGGGDGGGGGGWTFKAFPYSGVNDYTILCEPSFMSIGGGEGKSGLWLDDVLECGVSSTCATFGNEPLSHDGEKFDVMAVEVWSVS